MSKEHLHHRVALNVSVVGTKGLLNPIGENNCFLNSAVQVWVTILLLTG